MVGVYMRVILSKRKHRPAGPERGRRHVPRGGALAGALLLVAATAAAAEPAPVAAQRMADVLSALQARTEPETVFAPVFRSAVPPAQLAELVTQLEAQHGKLLAADQLTMETPTSGGFTLRFERATAAVAFTIEAAVPHRVTGLRITSVMPADDGPAKIAADFAALPGRSGFAIVRLGTRSPRLALHADEQFAIGSTFKLWVLDALAQDIAAGRHRWDEVVRLGPRSLPSGITQDWPDRAPVTVETLATLMISMSDNTATDTLIRLVGRGRIAARLRATGHSAPARNLPFLTTAESFALKLAPPAVRSAYARANRAGRVRILAELDTEKLLAEGDVTALDGAPVGIDSIEWFASPLDVARVLDSLRRRSDPRVLQILGVAPALPEELRAPFPYVGYKGGSEVGVISLSWLLRAKTGRWTVVTASWNDPEAAVDGKRFASLAQRLVRLAAQGS
jgi:beta-lactamase class A